MAIHVSTSIIQAPPNIGSATWKLAMESYHLFKVHREMLETVTPTKQAFYLEGGLNWSLTGGRYTDTSGMLTKWLVGEGSTVDRTMAGIVAPVPCRHPQ